MGFIHRVFPNMSQQKQLVTVPTAVPENIRDSESDLLSNKSMNVTTTKLTFDFHRLNVLLLRGIIKDGSGYGKKICTATMSEAKIQATVGKTL